MFQKSLYNVHFLIYFELTVAVTSHPYSNFLQHTMCIRINQINTMFSLTKKIGRILLINLHLNYMPHFTVSAFEKCWREIFSAECVLLESDRWRHWDITLTCLCAGADYSSSDLLFLLEFLLHILQFAYKSIKTRI